MGKSELQTSHADWSKRISRYASAGIPEQVWAPIATQDMTKTYQSGSQPMTNEEADTAVFSAWQGHSAVTESPRHSGGLLGDISTIASNIVPDVGNIITALPRGVFNLAKDVVTPSAYVNTGKDIGEALSSLGTDPGQSVRDIAKSPFLSLIPGVADIADLTTGAGRESLLEHPVTAALDVLPITKPLSAAAGAALAPDLVSEAGVAADPLSEALRGATTRQRLSGSAAKGIVGTDPRALTALAAGQPLRAGLRAIDRSLISKAAGGTQFGQEAAEEGLGPGQAVVRKALARAKLDSKNRALSATVNRRILADQMQLQDFSDNQIGEMFKELGGDQAKEEAFFNKASIGDVASMDAAERTVYDKILAHQINLADTRYFPKGELAETETGVFPTDAPIVKAYRARDVAASAHESNVRDLHVANDRLQTAHEEEAKRVGTVQAVIAQVTKSGGSLNDAQIEALAKYVRPAVTARKAAEKKIATITRSSKSRKGFTQTAAELKKADERVQKKTVAMSGSGIPGHLHPLVRQIFKDRAAKALESQRVSKGASMEDLVDTEGTREAQILSTYNEAFKELSTTPFLDRYYDYVGKKETQQLFADSIHEALKLSKEGLTPLFFHTPRSTEASQILSLHSLPRTKDIAQAQVKEKLFSLSDSVFLPRMGLIAEAKNNIARDGMQAVHDEFLTKFLEPAEKIRPRYEKAAQTLIARGKRRGIDQAHLATDLMNKEWTKFDYAQYGIRRIKNTGARSTDMYLPKDMADNLASFAGEGKLASLGSSRLYSRTMRVFRTSVLYGPRHFAHVVIGGMMPLLMAHPSAVLEFPQLWGMFRSVAKGEPFTGTAADILPTELYSHFNYKTDGSYKLLQTKVGNKYAEMLKDYWDKSGAHVGDKMAGVENAAQSMYQASVYLRNIKKGVNPIHALEMARQVVVNLDTMSPFERTVLKQVFPFYSFTRFATKFLVQLPFDHPLRVAMMSQIANQAREEWGTGLPQTMMDLFFFGAPDSKGNISGINMRNINPFRSVANMFTLGGFISSMNPVLQAPLAAMGMNTLDGTPQLYPEIVYDAATGTLTAARPKGDLMTAAEGFVPELGAVDAYFGISDNLRTLKTADQGAFDRELENMFNIPFAYSTYNMPTTRGKVALNAYKGAQNALTQYKKSGDFSGTIGRYNLIPYQGQLIPPAQFAQYWDQLTKQYRAQNPGADVAALLPKITTPTTNVLSELENYYQTGAR